MPFTWSPGACIHVLNINVVMAIGKGEWSGCRWVKGTKVGTERDFAWGDGHTVQHADGVLLSCMLETCTVL